jgi:Cu/Zn superoxide dismutase
VPLSEINSDISVITSVFLRSQIFRRFILKQNFMRTATTKISLLSLLFFFFLSSSFAQHLSDRIMLTAELKGQNEVPPVTTTASGVASFLLNSARDSMQVNVSVTGLSGPITGAHIHTGSVFNNGPVLINLNPFVQDNVVRMIITGADLTNNLGRFLSGGLYINFHTSANAGGEIRGQIEVESDYGYYADLNGQKQIPSVTTSAQGVAILKLNRSMDSIDVHVATNDMSDTLISAHLHTGDSANNGGVILDLSSLIKGTSLRGTVAFPSISRHAIDSGNVYINLHTTSNPNGEIRGQLEKTTGMRFDAVLTNDQEPSAPTVTNGFGTASFILDSAMSTLYYDILVDSLTDTIIAAHIHQAPFGQSGSVVFGLGTITSNRISGSWSSTSTPALTDALISELLKGNLYVNVHTTANLNGELRGQIYKLAREGFVMELDAQQEVPPTTSTATGGGMISIDRDRSNLHFMMTVSGLTGPITAAHFHHNVRGQNGGVIFNLTPAFSNNGAFGYWTSLDTPPFDTTQANSFFNDSMYANIHTSANPGGEVRGQLTRDYRISSTTSIGEHLAENNIRIFPNPFSGSLNLELKGSAPAEIIITDMTGKQVFSASVKTGETLHELNLSTLERGIYLLSVKQGHSNYISKIAKY